MLIHRILENRILSRVDYVKAIILLGPRQVGKTTLIRQIAQKLDINYLYVNGDEPTVQSQWQDPSQQFLFNIIKPHKVILIDEAQRIRNIGLTAKRIVDAGTGKQLIITGSSALDLNSELKEPLTGRKWEFQMFPFSWLELQDQYSFHAEYNNLDRRLVMGSYPDVATNPDDDKELLVQLAGSYLYKDVLENGSIRRPDVLSKILQALAWQVGNEISYNEISRLVEVDKNTVINYIDLLEKSFVIFRLKPLARNHRNEISSSRKIYFYDNGIRNALINQLAPIESRNDIGALWENYLIAERMKLLHYNGFYGSTYFWRSRDSEVDYIEEIDGSYLAFEFKWNLKSKSKWPILFMDGYHPKTNEIIHRNNFYTLLDHYPY